MHLLDYGIIGAFLAYAIYCGLKYRKKASENLNEFFLAGRSLNGWSAGTSMAATQFAADTPLLITGLIATGGLFGVWRLWIYGLAFLVMAFLLARCWRNARVITDAALNEFRYTGASAKILRVFKSIYLGVFFNCAVLAMVLLASVRILEPFLPWHEWIYSPLYDSFAAFLQTAGLDLSVTKTASKKEQMIQTANGIISIGFLSLITLFYSTAGGLKTVVRTDVVQFVLAMVATVAYAFVLLSEIGGLSGLREGLQNVMAKSGSNLNFQTLLAIDPTQATQVGTGFLIVIAIQWFAQINSDGTGYLAQRSMACKTAADAKFAGVLFTFLQIFIRSVFWVIIGLSLLVFFTPDYSQAGSGFAAFREFTFVLGFEKTLPAGLLGLMVAGLMAALLSTIDTHLNWGSSYLSNDIYKRFFSKGSDAENRRANVWVARLSNVGLLALSIFLVFQLSSIQQAWRISLLLGAGVGVIMLLRWFWWRISGWGELSSIVAAALLAPFLLFYFPESQDAYRMVLAAFVPAGIGILVSCLDRSQRPAALKEFYERVGPPGFWKAVEKHSKVEQKSLERLKSGGGDVILSSLFIFGNLIGTLSFLVPVPTPKFFPLDFLWPYFCIIVANASGGFLAWRYFGRRPKRPPSQRAAFWQDDT